jgi:hypothetical protein
MALLACFLSCHASRAVAIDVFSGMQRLQLINESKVTGCIPAVNNSGSFESSGVIVHNGHLIVNFDNLQDVAVIKNDLSNCGTGGTGNLTWGTGNLTALPHHPDSGSGYEAITRLHDGTFILVQETAKLAKKDYRARAHHYSDLLAASKPVRMGVANLSYKFKNSNKGVEGAATVYHKPSGNTFLFALCEGNDCKHGSDDGKVPGKGTVLVYWQRGIKWTYNDKIKLPPDLPFVDFSGMDARIDPNGLGWQVAVVSQTTSGLWIGNVMAEADSTKPSGLNWGVYQSSAVYSFPRSSSDQLQYCNVEGVSFIPQSIVSTSTTSNSSHVRLAFASDKAKKEMPDSCRTKDQSVHVFEVEVPGPTPPPSPAPFPDGRTGQSLVLPIVAACMGATFGVAGFAYVLTKRRSQHKAMLSTIGKEDLDEPLASGN